MLATLHLDDDLVAVSKPSGMLVHRRPGCGRDDRFALQEASASTGRFVFPVHRLDRATSGILCFAFSSEMARSLQANLQAEDAEKSYLVLARGDAPDAVDADRPLRNERGEPRPCLTRFRCLARGDGCSLLEARLATGRHHQIRRHLNHLGHHAIGDTTHGKGAINRRFRTEHGLPRLFLHAWKLRVRHPRTDERLRLEDALPEELVRVARSAGIAWP